MRSGMAPILAMALVRSVGCREPEPDTATVVRQRLVTSGLEVGELRSVVPAALAGVAAGKRTESRCAPTKLEGRALELCLWRYPDMHEAIAWASSPDGNALPVNTISSVFGEYVLLMTPLDGPSTPELRQKVARALAGKP